MFDSWRQPALGIQSPSKFRKVAHDMVILRSKPITDNHITLKRWSPVIKQKIKEPLTLHNMAGKPTEFHNHVHTIGFSDQVLCFKLFSS